MKVNIKMNNMDRLEFDIDNIDTILIPLKLGYKYIKLDYDKEITIINTSNISSIHFYKDIPEKEPYYFNL